MEVCLDTNALSNQQVVSDLAPMVIRAVDCYQDCQFLAPCRQKCQTDFTQDLMGSAKARQITRYVTINRSTSKSNATSSGYIPSFNPMNLFSLLWISMNLAN